MPLFRRTKPDASASAEVATATEFSSEKSAAFAGTGPIPQSIEGIYRGLFDDSPVGIALLDKSNLVERANSSFQELVRPNSDVRNCSILGLPLEKLLKLADGREWTMPMVPGLPHGMEVVFGPNQSRSGTLFVGSGDGATRILHLIDTSHLKKLEMQFAQSQKMLAVGKLAGGIAHDFNNLLTAIIGFCDLLLMRHQPGDPSFADMMQIKQNANRAANLVRQLLAFSRQQTLQPQTICLPDIVADLSNLLNRLLGAGISLDVNHGNDVCPVRVDRIQLEQVLINLAVNGRDAMQGNGVLSIRCQNAAQDDPRLVHGTPPLPPGEWVFIRVADTGQGILPEHLDQIFEPFFTTKPVGEGTGLGLSTVFGIVKQTGGYIYAENLKNGGAAFSIYLPADTESEVLSTPKQPRADLTGNATILLVEDEDPVRMFCARALRSKGYRVTEARNGQAAISLIENNVDPFDLMITDVVMPEMDGPTLIEMSRAIRPDLPIICISGYADGSFRDRINQFGNLLFLGKPFTLQQLAKVVKDATSSKFSNL